MAATKTSTTEGIFQSVLVNYLVSQARTVEASVNRALWALLERNERLASEVFLNEPRINEMEITIDEHAIRMLRQGNLLDTDVRLIVATLKINGKEHVVDAAALGSASDFSIYDGRKLHGWPITTVSRGEVVVRDGEFVGEEGWGRYLRRAPSMAAA